MSQSPLRFYRVGDPFGEFSNFAAYPVRIEGELWPTTEHYFQAQKFSQAKDASRHMGEIRQCASPMVAARMGRDRERPLRRDWESAKDQVMMTALRAKFGQHDDLRELLLSTGTRPLVEHTRNDSYWADGGDGSGKNKLGLLLMRLRDELQDALQDAPD